MVLNNSRGRADRPIDAEQTTSDRHARQKRVADGSVRLRGVTGEDCHGTVPRDLRRSGGEDVADTRYHRDPLNNSSGIHWILPRGRGAGPVASQSPLSRSTIKPMAHEGGCDLVHEDGWIIVN